jgi:hypothetical protein
MNKKSNSIFLSSPYKSLDFVFTIFHFTFILSGLATEVFNRTF